jgi:hypothetical protein
VALVLALGGCEVIPPFDDPDAGIADGQADGQGTHPTDAGLRPDARADWCGARAVLHDNCVPCHGVPPVIGPMSLVTIDDLRLWSPTYGKYIYELVRERIHDARLPMPPAAWNDPLTPEEMGTLDAWIVAGAEPADCDPP